MAKTPPARPLTAYAAKRDFTRSPEPSGRSGAAPGADARTFCVQKHLASHLHYDFRLEHRGVLLSWAVPKGPSLKPADKRMAVHVEDHPVDYGDFEGVIPDGYGAGVVLLWDRGTWTPEPGFDDVDAALGRGEIKFRLDGLKLKGSWVLVRTRRQTPGRPEKWLLIKHRDRWAGEVDVTQLGQSVKTFGDLASVLAAEGVPPAWRTAPPAKDGEAGRMFKDVIAASAAEANCPATALAVTERAHGPAVPSPVRVKFTHRDKVLFPDTGFTKGDLIDYYARVAPLMLPHLAGRAVTFKRFPDGVAGKSFFEKHCPDHRPPWVSTVHVPGEKAGDKAIDYCTIDRDEALQWAANLGAIELHVPLALAAAPDVPTALIFDLDPGLPATLADCVRVGLRLEGLLDELGLKCVPKTSGGKGLHVLVPLNTPGVTFARTKAFARAVATTLAQDDPKHVTATMSKSQRVGRVFIDWGQDDRDKTNACLFSVREGQRPALSRPMSWAALSGFKGPVLASDKLRPSAAASAMTGLARRQQLPTARRYKSLTVPVRGADEPGTETRP